jgi:2-polyprenyl-3-methyl-5-hydroxy-6-metoxy-1,4-benzoquinol methylase
MHVAQKAKQELVSAAQSSLLYNFLYTRSRRYPRTREAMLNWEAYSSFWYYSVELLPDITTKGIYPEKLPHLPRMLLRNCDLNGADCLDIGSMEGLIPVLMCRQGARRVLATDFNYHAYPRMRIVQRYYDVDFSFKRIGLLYDLSNKICFPRWRGFDLINVSGVLYHVFSPFQVIAGLRPLLKRGGIMIVSTNVVERDGHFMEFNNSGRLQSEINTFWYLSIQMVDYMLRYFQLVPIDCLYYKYPPEDGVRYVEDVTTGYLSVACRAVNDKGAPFGDKWLTESIEKGLEYSLCNQKMIDAQSLSNIGYRNGNESIELSRRVRLSPPLESAPHPHDSNLLRLNDRI